MGQEPAIQSAGQVPEGVEIEPLAVTHWLIDGILLPIMGGAEDEDDDADEDPDENDGDEEEDESPPVKKKKGGTFDREYVSKLRRESAEARNRAKAAEAKLKAREDAELSELDKAKKTAQEAEERANKSEERLRRATVRVAIEREARKLGFVDEEAAYRLLDHDDLELDDDGAPTNAEDLLTDLLKRKPYLKARDDESGDDSDGKQKKNGVPSTPKGGKQATKTREQIVDEVKQDMRATGRYHL